MTERDTERDRAGRGAANTLRRTLQRMVGCLALLGLTACPSEPIPGEVFIPTLTLRISGEQRVAQGAATVFTAFIERESFTGPVELSTAAELPSGVSVEFDPKILPAGVSDAVIRVAVSPTAPVEYVANPAVTIIPIVAVGPGTLKGKSDVRVVLTASSLAGVTLNVTPPRIQVLFGEEGDFLITLARQGNYRGAVSVAPKAADALGFGATITPVNGVSDTWRMHVAPTDMGKMLSIINLLGGDGLVPFSWEVVATPTGLTPVSVTATADVQLPFFFPSAQRNPIIVAGQRDSVLVVMQRSVRFTAPITMTIDEAPPGITATFVPNPVVDDAAFLKLDVSASVAPGEYTVAYTGTPPASSGAVAKSRRIGVTVTAPAPVPTFTLSAPTVTVPAGSSKSETFTVTRAGGFSGAVNVAFASVNPGANPNGAALPTGMSVSLGQNPVSQGTTTLQVSTTSATPAGSYELRASGVGVGTGAPTASTTFTVIVTPPVPQSIVTRVLLEPANAEITAPATQQYAVRLYDASGALVTSEVGGTVEYRSSRTAVATINASTGLATGVAPDTTTITARYVRNGVIIAQDATPLTVYAAGSAGHYGSATMSTAGNVRTIRRGESVMFQIIVRNAAGTAITSGVNPAPTVVSSNPGVIGITSITGPVPGYFFDMTAAFAAPLGTEVRIRYDVMGAGGELVIRVVP